VNIYSTEERGVLLQAAHDAIEYGLQHQDEMHLGDISALPESLQQKRATFITLNVGEQLRGCIGSLEAYQPLIEDVAHNAFAAAFRDPRFPPLTKEEFAQVSIHISVLSEPVLMEFTSEEDLVQQLRPNVDGLILSEGMHKGTFLPAVWDSLSDPKQFLSHLKMKAGLPTDYWSDTLTVERYTAETIE
jgi:uncharacterized protein